MTATQIGNLTSTELQAFSPTQANALTAKQVGSLTTTALGNFSTTQLSSLTTAQVQGLTTSQLNSLPATNLDILDITKLSTGQIAGLSTTQFSNLATTQLNAFTSTQVKAIELGRNPKGLDGLKQKLAAERGSCLLFNTPLLVEKLEDLYRGMWDDYKSGSLPRPDLNNLDAYHEIAVRLHVDDPILSGTDLMSRYRRELEEWNEAWPLATDSRLWQGDNR